MVTVDPVKKQLGQARGCPKWVENSQSRRTAIDPLQPFATGNNRLRLCENVFERNRYSKLRFYAKSTSADVPINFRVNVEAQTSNLAKRFYTLWAKSRHERLS